MHTGFALLVVVTGVLIAAVDTTIVVGPARARALSARAPERHHLGDHRLSAGDDRPLHSGRPPRRHVRSRAHVRGGLRRLRARFTALCPGHGRGDHYWLSRPPRRRRSPDQRQQRRRDRRHVPGGTAGPGLRLQRCRLERRRRAGHLAGRAHRTYVSWRWIFGINVPIGIAATSWLCGCCAIAASVTAIAWTSPAWSPRSAGSSVCCGPSPVWPRARSTPPCSATSSAARPAGRLRGRRAPPGRAHARPFALWRAHHEPLRCSPPCCRAWPTSPPSSW